MRCGQIHTFLQEEKRVKKAEAGNGDLSAETTVDINLDSDEEDAEMKKIEEARKRRQDLLAKLSHDHRDIGNDQK